MNCEPSSHASVSVTAAPRRRWWHYLAVMWLVAISQVVLPMGTEWAMFSPIRLWHILLIRAIYALVVFVVADLGLASVATIGRKVSIHIPPALGILLIIVMLTIAIGFVYLAVGNEGPARRIFVVMAVKAVVVVGIIAWRMFFRDLTERETN